MMESLISEWDGESLIIRYDQPTGAWIFIAIHSTRLGPATGGIRVKNYPNPETALQDALRLATAMTYKFAVPGISRGGGKAVISLPEDLSLESYHNLLRRFGKLLHQLGGLFYTGMDVGTTPEDMNIIAEREILLVLAMTGLVLRELGFKFESGAGVSAAQETFLENLKRPSAL